MTARVLLRIAALLLLFLLCAPIHIVGKAFAGRSSWPPRFLAASAWIIGARVRLEGAPIQPHSLLVSNHTSWLDILVLGGATRCAFIAKDELGHPLIHWLADQNDTVYVKRTDRRAAMDQAIALANALERGRPLAIFPEGTTGPGTELLPFRPALLEGARLAAADVEIRPVAMDYADAAASISWWKDSGKDNVMRLLGRRGTLPVTIRILEPLNRSSDRKQLAQEAQAQIRESLGLTSAAHSPIGGVE